MSDKPKIITLCGSTRFIEHFAVMAWELEKQGAIVLGLHYLPPSSLQKNLLKTTWQNTRKFLNISMNYTCVKLIYPILFMC